MTAIPPEEYSDRFKVIMEDALAAADLAGSGGTRYIRNVHLAAFQMGMHYALEYQEEAAELLEESFRILESYNPNHKDFIRSGVVEMTQMLHSPLSPPQGR